MSKQAAPIGKLTVAGKEATLTPDGWQSSDAKLSAFLNTAYPIGEVSPADGTPGFRLLARAAEKLGGEATYAPQPPGVPGRIH